jgi:hypothetical protein
MMAISLLGKVVRSVLFAVVAIVVLASPTHSWADDRAAVDVSQPELGAGVGASPLELAAPAYPGTTHDFLPELLVVNTGTVTAHYELAVARLSKGSQRTLPANWIQFAANDFQLAPKARKSVVVRAIVPSSASAGSYKSDVVVTGVVRHGKGQAAAGAAAATIIAITIRGGSPGSFPWYVAIGVVGCILFIALILLVRRSGIHLTVERR